MQEPANPMRANDRPSRSHSYDPVVRCVMMVVIAASLLPILLGGIAENEQLRRDAFRKMREEHMRRIAAERIRLAERRRAQAEAYFAGDLRPH